jgi:hypothetical protein
MPNPKPTNNATPEPVKPEPKTEPEPKKEPDKPLGKDGKEFDPERAQHTIETLRAESKQREDERKALEAKLKEFEDANLSESERLKKTAEEKEREAAGLTTTLQETRLKLGIYVASTEVGCTDPELALAAIDRSKIKFDESGEPTNLKDELEALLERKPILKGTPGKPTAPAVNAGDGARPGPAPTLKAHELDSAKEAGMSPEKFAALKDCTTAAEYAAVEKRFAPAA